MLAWIKSKLRYIQWIVISVLLSFLVFLSGMEIYKLFHRDIDMGTNSKSSIVVDNTNDEKFLRALSYFLKEKHPYVFNCYARAVDPSEWSPKCGN